MRNDVIVIFTRKDVIMMLMRNDVIVIFMWNEVIVRLMSVIVTSFRVTGHLKGYEGYSQFSGWMRQIVW